MFRPFPLALTCAEEERSSRRSDLARARDGQNEEKTGSKRAWHITVHVLHKLPFIQNKPNVFLANRPVELIAKGCCECWSYTSTRVEKQMKEKPTENIENTCKCQRAKTAAGWEKMIPAGPVLVFHLALNYGTTGDNTDFKRPLDGPGKAFLKAFQNKLSWTRTFSYCQDMNHTWLQGEYSRWYT